LPWSYYEDCICFLSSITFRSVNTSWALGSRCCGECKNKYEEALPPEGKFFLMFVNNQNKNIIGKK
jgi:hypothetical protein